MMAHIVGIRFHGGGKTYHFDASSVPEIKKGEYVIVETSRGQQLGQVVSFQDPGDKNGRNWKPILRSATSPGFRPFSLQIVIYFLKVANLRGGHDNRTTNAEKQISAALRWAFLPRFPG